MPVIGRLDDQVDEIIIKPVSERRRGEDDETAARPRPTGEELRPPSPSNPSRDETTVRPGELPVWML
ncbi:MAG TPA: hypothetical protein VD968_08550 [Pyrinomonadaceae bacterium]|nr:hypothetical protein [Pyrinomonadaceae bacterium]